MGAEDAAISAHGTGTVQTVVLHLLLCVLGARVSYLKYYSVCLFTSIHGGEVGGAKELVN